MEGSRPCKSCRNRTLVPDDVTGNMVCASCGVVQDFDNFQAHIGGVTGEAGTYVRVGTVGSGSVRNYKENKIFEAQKLIEDFMFKLGLSGSKSHEVKLLVEKITDAEYGQGKWFPVFVGACAYVVMRKDQKMLPIVEVADLVGCDVYELGRMISRVVDFIDLKLPEFDIVKSFERSIKSCPSFGKVPEDVVQRMLQQGVFLIQCLIKWFVTTGRKPMPVVAAVLLFVGELNQVHVKIEDLAKELHVAVITCRRRYKELLERLVAVAKALPWGKDVTVKNIVKNAPFVIQYMEMKSTTNCTRKGESFEDVQYDMEGLVGDCLSKEIGYRFDSYTAEDSSSQYFEVDHASNSSSDYPDKFQISPESLTMIYSNFLDEVSLVKATEEIGIGNKRKRRKMFDLQACTDWWLGKSDLSKKLLLKQILEKDVGLDAMPPSFDKACLVRGKRQEKIKAAKLRIQRIMHPGIATSGYSNDICLFDTEKSEKKRKKMKVDMDWEDLIIETLLLHNVKEEEIENGHYNVLLALHVFDDGIA
ncbi:Plant-specific TFIIB-related protein PTF2 [Sesamum alatum]|uniref:Plant-specific TFIIB-related protein PTF2 n=1 Tax=Sesamum alatum TaxID=300844 RepID=A0AAE1Z279_9LAMI|nr:Plant-specific TFIIB-related protein PTF2 [Sesamum alatum]